LLEKLFLLHEKDMRRSTIYGDSPGFDDLPQQMKFFNGRIRLMGTGLDLEAVIAIFMTEYEKPMQADPERRILNGDLTLTTTICETIKCQITMHRISKKWIFEEIRIEVVESDSK
jgi:hypothetical protein